MSIAERKEQLCRIIRSKCRYPVSSAQLDRLVEQLNVHRIYFIKTTSDPDKFLNIATSEHIETKERFVLSQVFPLYGHFCAGCFIKTETESVQLRCGSIDEKQDAAALKVSLQYLSCGIVMPTYTIVLFESGKPSAA